MSLHFETKNWKVELTLEALHIQPINHSSDDSDLNARREPHRIATKKSSMADYFLSKTIVPSQSSIIEQE